jgi:hypothetical protein
LIKIKVVKGWTQKIYSENVIKIGRFGVEEKKRKTEIQVK